MLDVRDRGLLLGEGQTAFCKEPDDDGFDLRLQQVFGLAGDDEVIRLSHEIDA